MSTKYTFDFKEAGRNICILLESDVTPPTLDSLNYIGAYDSDGEINVSELQLSRALNGVSKAPHLYLAPAGSRVRGRNESVAPEKDGG